MKTDEDYRDLLEGQAILPIFQCPFFPALLMQRGKYTMNNNDVSKEVKSISTSLEILITICYAKNNSKLRKLEIKVNLWQRHLI